MAWRHPRRIPVPPRLPPASGAAPSLLPRPVLLLESRPSLPTHLTCLQFKKSITEQRKADEAAAAELAAQRRAKREAAQDKAEAVRRKQMRHVLFTQPEVPEVRAWGGRDELMAACGAGCALTMLFLTKSEPVWQHQLLPLAEVCSSPEVPAAAISVR